MYGDSINAVLYTVDYLDDTTEGLPNNITSDLINFLHFRLRSYKESRRSVKLRFPLVFQSWLILAVKTVNISSRNNEMTPETSLVIIFNNNHETKTWNEERGCYEDAISPSNLLAQSEKQPFFPFVVSSQYIHTNSNQ